MGNLRKPATNADPIDRVLLFKNFIADGPHKNARVVTIATDQVREIALMPSLEEAGVIIGCLSFLPHIKRFVQYEKAHPIG